MCSKCVLGLKETGRRTFSFSPLAKWKLLSVEHSDIIPFWSKEGRHRKRLQNITKFWMNIYFLENVRSRSSKTSPSHILHYAFCHLNSRNWQKRRKVYENIFLFSFRIVLHFPNNFFCPKTVLWIRPITSFVLQYKIQFASQVYKRTTIYFVSHKITKIFSFGRKEGSIEWTR